MSIVIEIVEGELNCVIVFGGEGGGNREMERKRIRSMS